VRIISQITKLVNVLALLVGERSIYGWALRVRKLDDEVSATDSASYELQEKEFRIQAFCSTLDSDMNSPVIYRPLNKRAKIGRYRASLRPESGAM